MFDKTNPVKENNTDVLLAPTCFSHPLEASKPDCKGWLVSQYTSIHSLVRSKAAAIPLSNKFSEAVQTEQNITYAGCMSASVFSKCFSRLDLRKYYV